MPHILIELSGNLYAKLDIAKVLSLVRDRIVATGVAPLAGCQLRVIKCHDYLIADGSPRYAFVHACVRLGAGRTDEQRRSVSAAVHAALADQIGEAAPELISINSVETVEIDKPSAKRTNPVRAATAGNYNSAG